MRRTMRRSLILLAALGVLLATIAGIDVGRLLVAGFVPGFVLAGLYALMIALQLWIYPKGAPPYDVERVSIGHKLTLACTHILPMGFIVFMVVGFITDRLARSDTSVGLQYLGLRNDTVAVPRPQRDLRFFSVCRSIDCTLANSQYPLAHSTATQRL